MQGDAFKQPMQCVCADREQSILADCNWALLGESMHGAGIACESCRQSPKNVIDYWLLCFVMLEKLNVPNDISSLGTANWWEQYAWSGWPVAMCSMTHLLPQLYISVNIRLQG